MPRRSTTARRVEWVDAHYSVLEGKVFEPESFSSSLLDLLEYQGLLGGYFAVRSETYPGLVKEFYRHMSVTKAGGKLEITSKVGGVKISLTENRIAKLLSLTTTGVSQYCGDSWIGTDNLGYQDYLGFLLGRTSGFTQTTRPERKWLSAEQKILVMLVADCLLPNNNKSSLLGKLECAFVYFLKHKVKFNLPSLMLQHMDYCRDLNRKSLPYGMILSWIFKKKGVKVDESVAKPIGKMVLDAVNLRNCNLFRLENNEYITLEEVARKPPSERGLLTEQLGIPVKKLKQTVQELGGGEEAEEVEGSDSESEENLRRKEVRTKREHGAMTHEERVVALLRQQNQMIEEGFSFVKAQLVTVNQRLDVLEAGSSRVRAEEASESEEEDAEDSEDDSSQAGV